MRLFRWIVGIAMLAAAGGAAAQPGPVVVWGEPQPQYQPPPGNFYAVTAGATYCAGIREDRSLVSWGVDPLVGAPSGTFVGLDGGTLYCVAIRTNGTLAAWGDPSFGVTSPPSGTFSKVSASEHHAVALRTDGTITTWGAFGPPTPSGQFLDVAAGLRDFCLAVRTDGTLTGWGSNTSGQLNVPTGQFVSVVAGETWGAALRSNGTVAIWGTGGGNANLLTGDLVGISANYFTVVGLRRDGTLTDSGIGPGGSPVPPGSFWGIASGNTLRLAVVPSPASGVLMVSAAAVALRRHRKITIR